MTFTGQDEVLTGGSGWIGRGGRTMLVEPGQVEVAPEVGGRGTSTFGLIQLEGGVADRGTGTGFDVLPEDTAD